jgi:hypothetical protein
MDQWALDLALLRRGVYEDTEGRRILCSLLGIGRLDERDEWQPNLKYLWHMENTKRRPPLAVRQALRRLVQLERKKIVVRR